MRAAQSSAGNLKSATKIWKSIIKGLVSEGHKN
jgi:hypothetical protein